MYLYWLTFYANCVQLDLSFLHFSSVLFVRFLYIIKCCVNWCRMSIVEERWRWHVTHEQWHYDVPPSDTEDMERLLVSKEIVWLLRSEEILHRAWVEGRTNKVCMFADQCLLQFLSSHTVYWLHRCSYDGCWWQLAICAAVLYIHIKHNSHLLRDV